MQLSEKIVTRIAYVDRYGRTLRREQVSPDRQHHLHHPEETPQQAAACQYYDVRTSQEVTVEGRFVTYNSFFNVGEFITLQWLASAS